MSEAEHPGTPSRPSTSLEDTSLEDTELTLSHLDSQGQARMVDVTQKDLTARRAVARGQITMLASTVKLIAEGGVPKGDVLAVARVAGIQAAKKTSELIPLCHPIMVGAVSVDFEIQETSIEIECQVDIVERTGIEMEALTAVSVAALTIYDMCKAADKSMTIGQIALWEKSGGRSGTYRRMD